MGLNIYYRGKLNQTRLITQFRNELKDIAITMKWPYREWDNDWAKACDARIAEVDGKRQITGHLPLKGITFQPSEKCESLQFIFDPKGNLRNIFSVLNNGLEIKDPKGEFIQVKTQFASPDTHVWVMGLMRYLKKYYMSDLEVKDQGQYWETGNREALEEKMGVDTSNLPDLSQTLEATTSHWKDLDTEKVSSKLETIFKRAIS